MRWEDDGIPASALVIPRVSGERAEVADPYRASRPHDGEFY
jgi:hypothetical protein